MPRNMSFTLTIPQFKARSKSITRRDGWRHLKKGDIVCGVEKAMGLKKGEKIIRLGHIKIIDTKPEALRLITQEDVILEGFPNWTPDDFIAMLCQHPKITPDTILNRIQFEYLDRKSQEGKTNAIS